MGLQQPVYTVSEDGQELIICAILSGQIERDVTVSVSTEDGSAIGEWGLIIGKSNKYINYYHYLTCCSTG